MKNSLEIFTRASLLLAEADTIQKAKELKSMALTAADWARRKGMGEEAIQHCRSYALEAERRMGQMLAATERAKPPVGPGRGKKSLPPGKGVSLVPTLKELGLSYRESADAQRLAKLPKVAFESIRDGKESKSRALKTATRLQKRAEHEQRVIVAARNPKEQFAGPYDLILADPPWRYEHCEADNREIENQYPTASLEDIFSHAPRAAKESILFLWATAPKLDEALQTMKAWGFSYRSCAVWDKEVIGMGYWWRIQHELLLVGVKGKPGATPEVARVSSIFRERRSRHSAKPAAVYEWIERAFPNATKLEMYCRVARAGWSTMGNEV